MRLMRKLSDMIVYIGKQKMYPLLIVFFLGIAFFFILGQLYYSVRKKAYCEKLERTFKEVLLRQLQEDSFVLEDKSIRNPILRKNIDNTKLLIYG